MNNFKKHTSQLLMLLLFCTNITVHGVIQWGSTQDTELVAKKVKFIENLREKINSDATTLAEIQDFSKKHQPPPSCPLLNLLSEYPNTSDVLKKLLEKGANPDQTVEPWPAPIYAAINYGNEKALSILLQHNADISISREGAGTPFMFALAQEPVSERFTEMIKTLLTHPKKYSFLNLPQASCKREKDTALGLLVEKLKKLKKVLYYHGRENKEQIVENTIELLLSHSANPYLKNNFNKSAIDIAKDENKHELATTMAHEFKKLCVERLTRFLHGTEKRDPTISYGPFPPEIANLIAKIRYSYEG